MEKCTGATLNSETNEMESCPAAALYSAWEENKEENPSLEWRGNYCQKHAKEAKDSWEFRKL